MQVLVVKLVGGLYFLLFYQHWRLNLHGGIKGAERNHITVISKVPMVNNQNQILCIIPVKNNLLFTKLLISDIKCQNFADILVIDNESSDGTKEWLVDNNIEFVGFEGAKYAVSSMWNIGMNEANVRGYNYCCICNNDIRLPSYALETFKKISVEYDAFCVYPSFTVGEFKGFQKPIHEITRVMSCPTGEDGMVGFCQFFRTNVLDKIGGFDENLDLAWNDNDYLRRLLNANLVAISSNRVVIHHYGSQTVWKEPEWRERGEKDKKRYIEKWGE